MRRLELQGGGYTWEGIAEALAGGHLAENAVALEFGAEADNMYVFSADRATLETLQRLVQAVDVDPDFLRRTIEGAGDDIE